MNARERQAEYRALRTEIRTEFERVNGRFPNKEESAQIERELPGYFESIMRTAQRWDECAKVEREARPWHPTSEPVSLFFSEDGWPLAWSAVFDRLQVMNRLGKLLCKKMS